MNALFDKIKEIDREISNEVGGLVLFGLFKPEETPQRWDVVVSADWAGPEKMPALAYVAGKLQQRLSREQLLTLSRVVPLAPSEEFVQSVLRTIRVDHDGLEIYYRPFNGILMREAFIVTANPDSKPHAPLPDGTATLGAKPRIKTPAVKTGPRTRIAPKAHDL